MHDKYKVMTMQFKLNHIKIISHFFPNMLSVLYIKKNCDADIPNKQSALYHIVKLFLPIYDVVRLNSLWPSKFSKYDLIIFFFYFFFVDVVLSQIAQHISHILCLTGNEVIVSNLIKCWHHNMPSSSFLFKFDDI